MKPLLSLVLIFLIFTCAYSQTATAPRFSDYQDPTYNYDTDDSSNVKKFFAINKVIYKDGDDYEKDGLLGIEYCSGDKPHYNVKLYSEEKEKLLLFFQLRTDSKIDNLIDLKHFVQNKYLPIVEKLEKKYNNSKDLDPDYTYHLGLLSDRVKLIFFLIEPIKNSGKVNFYFSISTLNGINLSPSLYLTKNQIINMIAAISKNEK